MMVVVIMVCWWYSNGYVSGDVHDGGDGNGRVMVG